MQFHGNQPPSRVAEIIRAAHVFCLPSVRESGGAVLLEAMACGRPIIAVAFGGPAEVTEADVGCPVAAESPEQVTRDIARALADVFNQPEQWAERGKLAAARARTRYAWDAKVDAAVELYREILQQSPTPAPAAPRTDPAGTRS